MKNKGNWFVLLLMAFQSGSSLAFPVYKDTGWINETWFGNDLVTLLLVCPIFLFGLGSRKPVPRLLALGCLGYAVYNYSFYLLGTALNEHFLLYALIVGAAAVALAGALGGGSYAETFGYFSNPGRNCAAAFPFLVNGTGLGTVWTATWISHVFFGGGLPTEPEAFRLVAALDLLLIAFPLIAAGRWLLVKDRRGAMLGVVTGTQGSLYLLVLCLNSLILSRDDPARLKELPIWGLLLAIQLVGLTALFLFGRKAPSPRKAEGGAPRV